MVIPFGEYSCNENASINAVKYQQITVEHKNSLSDDIPVALTAFRRLEIETSWFTPVWSNYIVKRTTVLH